MISTFSTEYARSTCIHQKTNFTYQTYKYAGKNTPNNSRTTLNKNRIVHKN